MNIMRIQKIKRVNKNRLEYSYTIEGAWSRFFESSNPMWVEYSQPVDYIPDSVAILPLIGNIIVLASLMDANIYVDEIDQDFYECIEEFIQGYDSIMPDHVYFKHRDIVHANRIVNTQLLQTGREENLLFFSGGVDATFSLITHLEEKPALVTIWGADIPWDNEESWKQAIGFNQEVADCYGLNMLSIRSNFRRSLNDDNVAEYSLNLVDDWWWSAFHHSVAMMCLAAPLSCGRRQKLYFGSTYSSKDLKKWGNYVTASDPQIDDHVRFCGCQVVHDGYAFSRYDKIKHICDFYKEKEAKPYLRVCYLSNTGKNCGMCEKCASAIMAIRLVDSDPADYGFQYQEELLPIYFAAGLQEMARAEKYACLSFYKDIQTAYRTKYSIEETPPVLQAFYKANLESLADFLHVPNNECIAAVKSSKECQIQLLQQIENLKCEMDCNLQSAKNNLCTLTERINRLEEENQELFLERSILLDETNALEKCVREMELSKSWRITKPLRYLGMTFKKAVTQKNRIRIWLFEFPFRKLTTSDQKWVEKACQSDAGIAGHVHFISMLLCQEMYSYDSFRKCWGCILKKPWEDRGRLYCQYPIGLPENRRKAVETIVKTYSAQYSEIVFFAASDVNVAELKKLYENKVVCVEDSRNNQNYMLDAQEQIVLEGAQFADRRNKLRRFNKLNNWVYENITKENMEECLEINAHWYDKHEKSSKEIDGEQKALKMAFAYYDQLDLQGGIFRIDGKAAAFCIGCAFNQDIYMCLFMKARREYRDVSIALLHEFMKRNCSEYQYINYSEDLGIPGLRKFKTMLHPKFMTPFYSITLKF